MRDPLCPMDGWHTLTRRCAICTALAAARREALERAAKVARRVVEGFGWPNPANEVAAAIRALIETEAGKDGGTERRSEGASGGSSTPPTVPPSLRGVESPEAARPGAGSVERAQTATDASTDSPAASPSPTLVLWQHDETGRTVEMPEGQHPDPDRPQRWFRVQRKPAASPPPEPERCAACGYTAEDAKTHGDHHLCDNPNPPWARKPPTGGKE